MLLTIAPPAKPPAGAEQVMALLQGFNQMMDKWEGNVSTRLSEMESDIAGMQQRVAVVKDRKEQQQDKTLVDPPAKE